MLITPITKVSIIKSQSAVYFYNSQRWVSPLNMHLIGVSVHFDTKVSLLMKDIIFASSTGLRWDCYFTSSSKLRKV